MTTTPVHLPVNLAQPAAQTPQKLTPDQKAALANLHNAAQQLEGVFLQMVMGAMRDTVPKDSLFGGESASESTWQSMLDDQYSQQMSTTGGFGLAAQLESQMRGVVLGNARNEAHANVQRGSQL